MGKINEIIISYLNKVDTGTKFISDVRWYYFVVEFDDNDIVIGVYLID